MSIKRSKLEEQYGALLHTDNQRSEDLGHKDNIRELYKKLVSGSPDQFVVQNRYVSSLSL